MHTIKIKDRTIQFPSSWSEVSETQALFIFSKMSKLFAGQLQPIEFQFLVLQHFIGYKPTHVKRIRKIERGWLGRLTKLFRGKHKHLEMLTQAIGIQENINFNLIQLSEKIDFLFDIEDDVKIVPRYEFNRNPFYESSNAYFNRDITVETNITAKQFVDCIDLLRAIQTTESDIIKKRCSAKLVAELNHFIDEEVEQLDEAFIFGTVYWFTGIYHFFRTHPIYSILYGGVPTDEDEEENDTISLGMTEILLYLEKEGYQNVEKKNIVDFFNAQVKALKDSLANAIANGAKIEDLAKKTKISITNIRRLTNE